MAFFIFLIAALPLASTDQPKDCFWVAGRLSAYNGTPTFRIWPRGTRRLLGVVSRNGEAERSALLPLKIRDLNPSFDRDIWGEFRICALEPERRGRMRMVEIIDGRSLRAVPR